tara:strand:- start:51937 stop:52119 length:183 start_codon:yes stop_codon:yes gene_type:complete
MIVYDSLYSFKFKVAAGSLILLCGAAMIGISNDLSCAPSIYLVHFPVTLSGFVLCSSAYG